MGRGGSALNGSTPSSSVPPLLVQPRRPAGFPRRCARQRRTPTEGIASGLCTREGQPLASLSLAERQRGGVERRRDGPLGCVFLLPPGSGKTHPTPNKSTEFRQPWSEWNEARHNSGPHTSGAELSCVDTPLGGTVCKDEASRPRNAAGSLTHCLLHTSGVGVRDAQLLSGSRRTFGATANLFPAVRLSQCV